MRGRGANGVGRNAERVVRGGVLGAVTASGLGAATWVAARLLCRRRASGSSTGVVRGSPDRREDCLLGAEPDGAVDEILP